MDDPQKPRNHGKPWLRDELVLAFELYCRTPFDKTKASNPNVRQLASWLHRTPASVARKLGNFGAFDPELKRRNISGLTHTSKADRDIWNEFSSNWNGLVLEASRLKSSLEGARQAPLDWRASGETSERTVSTRQRVCQSFFRAAVITSYDRRCCITGIPISECLTAAHIVPWNVAEEFRADPTNGLCLTATFHRLFDAGVIAITERFTVMVSGDVLRQRDESLLRHIAYYQGRRIFGPRRFAPSLKRLEWHRQNVFRG